VNLRRKSLKALALEQNLLRKNKIILTYLIIFVAIFLLIRVVFKKHSPTNQPYQWVRTRDVYENPFYGIRITKKDSWLRYKTPYPFIDKINMSWQLGTLTPFFSAKTDLIEFNKIGDDSNKVAYFMISAVEDLRGKYYGKTSERYARFAMESLMSLEKVWLEKADISTAEIGGMSGAKAHFFYQGPDGKGAEAEMYCFIQNEKGYNVIYFAQKSDFDKYYEDAKAMFQSFHFTSQ
jgi:hypothetical protein